MNKLLMLVALALALTFGFGEQASATPLGHRFCEQPLTSPEELATKLDRSLAIDPTGNRALEGCRANPLDFLEAWKYEQTGVTQVSELPGFVRRFEEVEIEPGLVIPSACVRVDGNGVVIKCEHRQRHPGEEVYGIDGVAFLLEDCVNPINLQLEDVVVTGPACVEYRFWTDAGQTIVRIAHMDDVPLPSTCLLLEGPGYGEPLRGLPQDCPDRYMRVIEGREVQITCSWRDDERDKQSPAQPTGSSPERLWIVCCQGRRVEHTHAPVPGNEWFGRDLLRTAEWHRGDARCSAP